MSDVLATAPGKAVLLGEYAVLDGAPALVMALDRRARVVLSRCDADECVVEAPQLGVEPVRFHLHDGQSLVWADRALARQALGQTAAVLEHLVSHAGTRFGPISPFRLHIDTAAMFVDTAAGPEKLGIGSGAAVAVALDAALSAHASSHQALEGANSVLERLLPVYRGTQQGHGSGIDLAASLIGGLLRYCIGNHSTKATPRPWPEGLFCRFVWSGRSASTTDLVSAWRRAAREQPGPMAELGEQMAACCQAGLASLDAGDAAGLARQMGVYGRLLGTMGDDLGLPVMTETHRRASELSEHAGVYYKPCGAGGGDLGVAVSTDPERLEAAVQQLQRAGLQTIPAALDQRGVTLGAS